MKKIFTIVFLFFITQKIFCQPWVALASNEQTSDAVIQTGALSFFTQVSNNGVPYISYIDDVTGGDNIGDFKVHARRFNNDQWEFAGDGISPQFPASDDFPVALDGNVPYVAYSEAFTPVELRNKLSVKRLNSNTGLWELVGQQGLSDGEVTGTAITADNGKIYVAYNDGASDSKITVKMFDNANVANGWQTVGPAGFSNGFSLGINIAVDNGVPYVAYLDFTDNAPAVKKFTTGSWEDVGTNSPSNGEMVAIHSLKFNSNHIPFIAFVKADGTGEVRSINAGNAWTTTGTQPFASGIQNPVSLAILNDVPFVAFGFKENGVTQLHVKRFNAAGNNWPDAGSQPVTASPSDINNVALVNAGNNKLLLVFRNLFGGIYAKTFDASGVLPVTFAAFTVTRQNHAALLQWTTEGELNNKLFEIEHSTDALTFAKIGETVAKIPANITHDYNFLHHNPNHGSNYYRLKQIDNDGNYTYSKIINISFSEPTISVSPNPVKDVLHAGNLPTGSKEIVIRNIEGKTMIRLHSSAESIDINVADLPKGYYVITFAWDAHIKTSRFIK